MSYPETNIGAEKAIAEHLKYMVQSLDIDNVEIMIKPKHGSTQYNIIIDKADNGKLIGRAGRNINAIRTLVSAFALSKFNTRVTIEMVE